jgi:ABC-type multidrug transport system fused ATPase/permease subunit
MYHPQNQQMIVRRQTIQPVRNNKRPVWKQLWSKVEDSLDVLADLESVVQTRAQQLYASTVTRTATSMKQTTTTTRNANHKKTGTSQQQQQPVAVFDIASIQKNRYQQAQAQQADGASEEPLLSTQRFIRAGSSAPVDVQAAAAAGVSTSSSTPRAFQQLQQQHQQQQQSIRSIQSQQSPHTSDGYPSTTNTASARRQFSYENDDDNDDDKSSLLSRIVDKIPSFPTIRIPFFNQGSFQRDESLAALDIWEAKEKQERSVGSRPLWRRWFGGGKQSQQRRLTQASSRVNKDDDSPHVSLSLVQDLMERCQNGRTTTLLSKDDRQRAGAIGRRRAMLDVLALAALLVCFRELSKLSVVVPMSLSEFVTETIPTVLSSLFDGSGSNSADSWALLALAVTFLSVQTGVLLEAFTVEPLCETVTMSLDKETRCGSLFLRLYTGTPMDYQMMDRMQHAAREQVYEKIAVARLRLFVFVLLAALATMSVSAIQPLAMASVQTAIRILSLDDLRTWPIPWQGLFVSMREIGMDYASVATALLKQSLDSIADAPAKMACELGVFGVLAAAAYVPRLEKMRTAKPTLNGDEEEAEAAQLHTRLGDNLDTLGSSSVTRLCALSEVNAIESGLERWTSMLPQENDSYASISTVSFIRILIYQILAGLLLFTPIGLAYKRITPFGSVASESMSIQWNSFLDVAVVSMFAYNLLQKALSSAVFATEAESYVAAFLSMLSGAVRNRNAENQPQLNLELQATINPGAGLLVKDMWAAHTTRRAWAVRGANLECRSSEILVVFGESGAGKTRMLTTLAEAFLEPPRQAISTTRVRGVVSVCGVETNRWNKALLRRRLGLLLSNVQTVSDVSKAFSGMSIEEILEPMSVQRSPEAARNAMITALKITGLYSSLIPRLPSKLSTVITSVEEDLKPSTLRPRATLLSPTEWSKLLLTRVLAQAIYNNDNSASRGDVVDRCLVGSVLLLDDVTAYLSEAEEARLFRELRRTGSAVVIACNRWATGRFADRIVVMKDGALVEGGTHNQLLGKGPQYSLYAAQWQAMSVQ